MPEGWRAGAAAPLLVLLVLAGCADACPPAHTLCGECDEEGIVTSDLGAYSAPPPGRFPADAALVEFLSKNFNTPPPAGLDGSDAVLVQVLFEGTEAVVDARAIPHRPFHSRPTVRAAAPPYWLIVTDAAGVPVYWRTVEDPRNVRFERPGATPSQSIRGGRVRVGSGLATLRVPFVARGRLILHEAVPPGAQAKPPLAEYTFDLDVPLFFNSLGGVP